MKEQRSFDSIHIQGMRLWSHVGVLEVERLLGQYFLLDFTLWIDLQKSSVSDDINDIDDYSLAIKKIQELSFDIKCLTIEAYSYQILDLLEELYGAIPMQIKLTKCSPPVNGFTGSVSLTRNRNMIADIK